MIIAVLSLNSSGSTSSTVRHKDVMGLDNSGGKEQEQHMNRMRKGDGSNSEIHKLRHLKMVQHVEGKLEKQGSETEPARDRKWSFD